ncbi:uncharacterized protein RCC_07240 [Ramularia collo-cygni]|uniref:Uncharacterized protein n=1 Tax=Ramularia collo-cygni TaxID=112498 RepID=A0A2D3V9D9_9PEZI|nr:uncharacterized protein RCC_07240 [Ramularia collo-cygni]CZT21377.1 uncharacterized protein RCC_07240 [Ramularia collo-cygni]
MLDDQRRESIASASQNYRDVVLEQNLEALRYLVVAAEGEAEGLRKDDLPDEEIRDACLRLFSEQYGLISPDAGVATPASSLDDSVLPNTIKRCSLDGIDHGAVDVQKREAWFDAVHTAIASLHVQPDDQDPHNAVAEHFRPLCLPADFQYLATLVRGVCGPGLPHYRETSQFSFIVDPEEAINDLEFYGTRNRVVVPARGRDVLAEAFHALDMVWEDWQIAVGVKPGDGPRGWDGPWILYCRRIGDEGSLWGWRYGIREEIDYESELFDTIEDFLGFYACYNEQKGDRLEAIPLEQVM